WIQVSSVQMPRFEAVDGSGVHSISEQLASRCGYTISTFKMDGLTTFRASYYSCFTHKQDDSVFTFRFNVMVSDGGGAWISRAVSASCSGLSWTHREIVCEENYMETVDMLLWSFMMFRLVLVQAQRTATSVWQLMFLQSGGHVSSMSVSEAQTMGYSLTTTAHRVVLRSQYKQQHAKVLMVDGIPVEVIRVSVFFKNKLTVVIMDVTMAYSGSFDDTWLLWDVPWIMTPLVEEDARFESQSVRVGVEGVLLDEPTSTTRGFSLVRGGGLVQIGVPFGAEGGYRKSLVVNNVYKELYVIFLLYEHVFSLLYEDGSSITTRHRMVRVLDTPLLCRPPFKTISDDDAFSIYLGNIPADVILEEVWINRKQLMTSESINPVAHVNGSRAYKLRLPFDDAIVHLRYLGGGVVQFSIDVNFTLTIVPQRDSYHHHTVVTAHVVDAFPPQISAQCSDGGITFSVVRPHQTKSLWEVGVDQEPLTSQLAAQRGYHLHNDTHRTSLDVPVLSIGYTYEDINLSHFYGIFKLLLRDSKTLEVQTSTSKRCLFRTEDMMVCSADGTMTVVTTPTSTWPTVGPDRISLLDPTCRPKQADGSRVLFEFKVNSCGTRTMTVDEKVLLLNRLTVRCFYPLSGVNRLSVDRLFRAEAPGFGSIKVFESLEGRSPTY
uniref:ZP domain-containing protein n=1 Tax=Scophthalmus maximus TaxID=52904 RepID=A0A8D3EF61_SCOMX